ncbi:MAG: hypothetical protein EBR86_08195 [Planctomycetia bacterium]|nr:hypothetical protein [Planctomycetia bacterium]
MVAAAQALSSWHSRGLAVFRAGQTRGAVRAGRLAAVWLALVAVFVIGRFLQPAWNVTPSAAVALVAGAVFPGAALAASVPVAGLVISNLVLPGYESLTMAAVVFAATAWPVILRRWVRPGRTLGIAAGALVSSVVFFLTTNLAYWWLSHDYPLTIEGLGACYVAAVPFFRWMPLGDVAWSLALTTATAAMGHLVIGQGVVKPRTVCDAPVTPAGE